MERIIERLINNNKQKIYRIDNINLRYFSTSAKREHLISFYNYYKKHGTIKDIKTDEMFIENNEIVSIGYMVSMLRQAFKLGRLSRDEIDLLNKLGMTWEKRVPDFDIRILPLVNYAKQHGSIADIKRGDKYVLEGRDIDIGNMIYTLRIMYKKGELSETQISKLNNLGIVWEVQSYKTIEVLMAYFNQYGTLSKIKKDEKFNFNGNEINIGYIISSYRYKYNKGLLTVEEVEQLENMGMKWAVYLSVEQRIEVLKDYYTNHGSIAQIKTQDKYIYQGESVYIGYIVTNMRRCHGLTCEQIELLNSIGMVWDVELDKYSKMLDVLEAYHKQFGTIANIKKEEQFLYNGKPCRVGKIIIDFRNKYAKDNLPVYVIEELNKLGMVWNMHELMRTNTIEMLDSYYKQYGTLATIKTKTQYEYNGTVESIGVKVFYLRTLYKENKISQEFMEWMEIRGFEWSPKRGPKAKATSQGLDEQANVGK